MYAQPGTDGYISHVALTRRLRFVPDRWEKGFSKQVQAWGSRAHFMQVRVLFFMRHWFNRWTITIRKVKYVQPPKEAGDFGRFWLIEDRHLIFINNYNLDSIVIT